MLRAALEIGDGMLRACVTTEGFKPDEFCFLKPSHLTRVCPLVYLENIGANKTDFISALLE